MPRSKSVPFSYSRTPTPASSPSPSVSTQGNTNLISRIFLLLFLKTLYGDFTNFSFLEEDSDVNIKGKTTPTNEMLSSIPSPLRPLSLNIKSEAGTGGTASAGVVMKVDAQQQTPVESCHQAHNTHLQLRFADERYELKFSAKNVCAKKKILNKNVNIFLVFTALL